MATVKVQVLSDGAMRGQQFELTQDSYSIGRNQDCDICISDSTISGHHCTLFRIDEGVYGLRDEGSTNGTRVNGEKLESQDEVQLNNGDIFQCGGIELLFDTGEKRHTEHRTGNVINLEDTGEGFQTVVMQNMGARKGGRKKQQLREKSGQRIFFIVAIIVLCLAALGALGYFAMTIFGGK